jgi:hypothetical protein
METLVSIFVGLGLAAACGFRVFVPLLIMSVAAHTGHLELSSGFEWIGSTPALAAFATATVLEIVAYYIPWVDNLLDTVAVPSAVVAGTVVTASAVTDLGPFLTWTLAVIGGGGLAGLVQTATAGIRQVSTFTTGGLANPLVSTAEAGGSFMLAILALVVPVMAMAVIVLMLVFAAKKISSWRASRRTASA